jgi:hypothetical protein
MSKFGVAMWEVIVSTAIGLAIAAAMVAAMLVGEFVAAGIIDLAFDLGALR